MDMRPEDLKQAEKDMARLRLEIRRVMRELTQEARRP